MHLRPFTAVIYDDPEGSDGVVDASAPIGGSSWLSPDGLSDPANWTRALSSGYLRKHDTSGLYLFRSGSPDGTQHTGFFAWDSSHMIAGPSSDMTCVEFPDQALIDILQPEGVPLSRATDQQGNHHRTWLISASAVIEILCQALNNTSSGHHGLVAVSSSGVAPPPGLVFLA